MKIILFYFFCILCLPSFAQRFEIKGKVIDAKSALPLKGASIIIGTNATITNGNGYFSLFSNLENVEKNSLIISHIGYDKKEIALQSNKFYLIEMVITKNSLPEVIVSGNADRIIKKAIEKIPANYPTSAHLMEGLLRVYRTEMDSPKIYRFFKSDAVLSVLHPSYIEEGAPVRVRVIQNKIIYLKPNELPTDSAQWLGAYRIDNFIHQKADFVDIDKINKFKYRVLGKTILQERKVWIISFESKYKKHISGTLFIDTASYAFVAAQYSRFNIPMRINLIKKQIFKAVDEINYDVVFQMIGNRWYLYKKSAKTIYATKSSIVFTKLSDFICLKIDTTSSQLPYIKSAEYVRIDDKDNEVIKIASDSSWLVYDSIFSILENEKTIRNLQIPNLYNPPKENKKYNEEEMPFYKRRTYLENTLLRSTISLSSINLLSSPNSKGNLGIGIGIGIRVYKKTYLHFFGSFNFGDANKIISSKTSFFLTHAINLTNAYHPLFVSPLIGFNIAELGKKREHLKSLYNIVTGVTFSYPIIPKLVPYINICYDKTIKANGKLNLYYSTPTNFSFGFYYAIK